MAAELSELEGAILGELQARGGCTAYRVRRAFLDSPSAQWSGSAGAVYPALHRLCEAGLARTTPTGDRRGGEIYKLTASGTRALKAWTMDVDRATDAGYDPFRLRAGLWGALSSTEQRQLAEHLAAALQARVDALTAAMAAMESDDAARASLELALHKARLNWLRDYSLRMARRRS